MDHVELPARFLRRGPVFLGLTCIVALPALLLTVGCRRPNVTQARALGQHAAGNPTPAVATPPRPATEPTPSPIPVPSVKLTIAELIPLEQESVRREDSALVAMNSELREAAKDELDTARYARMYMRYVQRFAYASSLMLWEDEENLIAREPAPPYPTKVAWHALADEIQAEKERIAKEQERQRYDDALAEIKANAARQLELATESVEELKRQALLLEEQVQNQQLIILQQQALLNQSQEPKNNYFFY